MIDQPDPPADLPVVPPNPAKTDPVPPEMPAPGLPRPEVTPQPTPHPPAPPEQARSCSFTAPVNEET